MFKNRAMQVQMVKTPKADPTVSNTTTGHLHLDFDQINKIVLEQVKNGAVAFVAVVGSLKLIDAVCTIAVNAAPKH